MMNISNVPKRIFELGGNYYLYLSPENFKLL